MNMPKIVAPVKRSVLSQTKENENDKGGIQAQSFMCPIYRRACSNGNQEACYIKNMLC